MSKILSGHISPETAYVVEDYPYGFRLRCKIRHWLEFKPGKGCRFWSQTTNPKQAGDVWNKPKASTFCAFGGVMFLNDEGHVRWDGVHEYCDVATLTKWRDNYGHTMPEDAQSRLRNWITRKLHYEQMKNEGLIKCTVTTTQYGCCTDPGFGKPMTQPTVETMVLKSDYTPAQLLEMGQGLRSDRAEQMQKLLA